MSLRKGEIVRYGSSLWRVDYVNECRARIVPLAKRHVVLADGREFEAERGGVNISPNSLLEVVEDLERTKLEIEMEEAERELAALKAEAEREAAPKPTARPGRATLAAGRIHGQGWAIATAVAGLAGTKAAVYAFVAAHPGCLTKEVVVAGISAGAVAACLDRFRKIGVVIKG